jgi:hypothetical protein
MLIRRQKRAKTGHLLIHGITGVIGSILALHTSESFQESSQSTGV